MIDQRLARSVSALIGAALIAGPLPVRAERTIRCDSNNYRYQYCRANTDNHVKLERQRSTARCREGDSWGYDRHGIWVDRGCGADFRVGKEGGRNDALVAGAAIAGLAILAVMASNKSGQATDVASWAVGTFSGFDPTEQTDVTLTILPGGSVSGRAGRFDFEGSFHDPVLEAGRINFRVERSGNGFMATDERDPAHRVYFRRTASAGGGSGY